MLHPGRELPEAVDLVLDPAHDRAEVASLDVGGHVEHPGTV